MDTGHRICMENRLNVWLKKEGLIVCLILGLVVLIYNRSPEHDFINFDDPVYVTENPAITGGLTVEGVAWAFAIHSDICMYYQPVAWLSHMLDCHFFGLDPGKHHRTSVLIHAINASLLFLIMNAMTGAVWRSALAALIFAVHPVNVDAVAWISERKTVLCALFWLLGMAAYLFYIRKPSRLRWLGLAALFTLGLLTKPVMITFPCVLILLDIWPLKRTGPGRLFFRTIQEKIPLFIIAALWLITPFLSETLMAHETTPDMVSYGLRLSNALVSYAKYVITFFLPLNLSILYPYPKAVPLAQSLAALAFLGAVTFWSAFRGSKKPVRIIGWLWFCGTMFPTSGLILGTLWPEMADRWAYIPYIGLCLIVAWTLPEPRDPHRKSALLAWGLTLVFVIGLAGATRIHIGHYKDSIHIFQKALTVIDYHFLPHQNLATEWMKRGDYDQAKAHLSVILDHEPDHGPALFNMGLCLAETGQENQALSTFNEAFARDPGYTRAGLMAARMLDDLGRAREARTLLEQMLTGTHPEHEVLYHLALFHFRHRQCEEAEKRFIELLSAYPGHRWGNGAYADLLIDRKDDHKALIHAQKQVALTPDDTQARNRLGFCHVRLGQYPEALFHFEKALQTDPDDIRTRLNLETARTDQNAQTRALSLIREVLPETAVEGGPDAIRRRLKRHFEQSKDARGMIPAYTGLSTLYRLRGEYEKALALFATLLETDARYATSIHYNMACLHALMTNPESSVFHLNKALMSDSSLITHARNDPDFDGIRDHPGFRELMGSGPQSP